MTTHSNLINYFRVNEIVKNFKNFLIKEYKVTY